MCRVLLFHSVKVAEMPPVWERAAKSAYDVISLLVKIRFFTIPFGV